MNAQAAVVTISDIAAQVRGVSYDKADASSEPADGKIALLRANNIVDDDLAFDDLVYVPESRVSGKQRLRQHDVVIAASSGSLTAVGKAGTLLTPDFDGTFGAFCKVLRPDLERVDARYFSHFFKTTEYRRKVSSLAAGANINNLKNEHLDNLVFPLPPLDEQRRIAAILDKADALRQKRKRAIALLDSLTQSIFLKMFGEVKAAWPRMTIDQVGHNIRTGPFGSQLLHSEFVDDGIAVLGIDNVVQNTFVWGKPRFITCEKYRALGRYKVHAGDVLITIMGTIGRCAVVPSNIGDAINTKHLCCITPNVELVIPEYLKACFLDHPEVLRQLGQQSKGAIMDGLNMGIIKGLTIPVPPMAAQLKFACLIRAVTEQLSSAVTNHKSAEALFASLQLRAFAEEV